MLILFANYRVFSTKSSSTSELHLADEYKPGYGLLIFVNDQHAKGPLGTACLLTPSFAIKLIDNLGDRHPTNLAAILIQEIGHNFEGW